MTDTVLGGEKLAPAFQSFLRVDRLRLDVQRSAGAESIALSVLRGPGDNCTMVVPVVLDADGKPLLVLKAGSTRAAAELRVPGAYVMLGMVGGRWDKALGADPAGIARKVGLAELAEEVGATAVKGGAFTLGTRLTATMPALSTEADLAVGVLARLGPEGEITGDHGGMEVVGLMRPVALAYADALARSRRGEVGEGARFEAYARRFLDLLGFVPELDAYVWDLPRALQQAFSTHGLGPPLDPRRLPITDERESAGDAAHPAASVPERSGAAQVRDVRFLSTTLIPIPDLDAVMIDATTDHVTRAPDGTETLLGLSHRNQVLHVGHDLAKLVRYTLDPERGPLVRLDPIERPVLAAKGTVLAAELAYAVEDHRLVRPELAEVVVPLGLDLALGVDGFRAEALSLRAAERAAEVVAAALGPAERLRVLGSPTFASPGQSDLQLHFFAAEVGSGSGEFIPLGEALTRARAGELDAGSEATLLRLADALDFIPSLSMSTARARAASSSESIVRK